MSKHIDINCDLGEGLGNEVVLMPYLSSCNIACGGHAGDLDTMKQVAILAKEHKVKVGAHPSYPDRVNFGRIQMSMSTSELYSTLFKQINDLVVVLKSLNLELHHVKPHGALYNMASTDKKIAQIIVSVVKSINENLVLYAPYQSMLSKIAIANNLKVKYEGFADRNYNEDLTLVSRQDRDAVIHDPELIFEHVFLMVSEGKVKTKNGVEVEFKTDTICVHGDHKNVEKNLMFLTSKLNENFINIL